MKAVGPEDMPMVEDLAIEGRRRKAVMQRTERSQLGNRSQGVVG